MGADGSLHTEALPARARCPFCGGDDSKPLAAFGSLLMTSQYYCNLCHTTFESVRRESEGPRRGDTARRRGPGPVGPPSSEREPDES